MASIEQILGYRKQWLDAVSPGPPPAALIDSTLRRCREAVAQLGSQLLDFAYPVNTCLLTCPTNLDERVGRIEGHTGVPVPIIVREFWRIVGGIALVDLRQYRHVAFWDGLAIHGAHQFCDGVYVDTCDEDWLEYTVEDFNNYADDDDGESFLYSLAPDGYHKDDISGGPPYSVGRGSDWAPKWEDFIWSGYRRPETSVSDPSDFVSYLRTAILECAGFPGLFGHETFEDIRQKLIRELPPF